MVRGAGESKTTAHRSALHRRNDGFSCAENPRRFAIELPSLCIKLFLAALDRIGMLPFVIYRLILGIVLLVWVA